jgi:uncharacterized membrane-anchored protein
MTTPPAGAEPPREGTVIAALTNGSEWTRPLQSKVPPAAPRFWVLTLVTVTAGASTADFLVTNLRLGLAATMAVIGLALCAVLILEVTASRHRSSRYWSTVLLASVQGTLISDSLAVNLLGGHALTFVTLGAALMLFFVAWWRSEHSVSVRAVLTRRAEAWHWVAVLSVFAAAAAMADTVADTLGPAPAVVVFAGLAAMIAVARVGLAMHAVVSFWAAYVVVSALGECVADVLTATPDNGGLGLGSGFTSVLLVLLIPVGLGLSSQSGAGQVIRHTVRP